MHPIYSFDRQEGIEGGNGMNKNKNRALEPKYYMTDIDLI